MTQFYQTDHRQGIGKLFVSYGIGAYILWTLLIGISLFWAVSQQNKQTQNLAINTARASFNKDQAYRLWATSHGGVYVEPTVKTPPSPWMAHLPDRDLVTLQGKKLTLMNPAYMLREMMEDYSDLYGIRGRITGIVYLNPANKADPWEARAIRSFEKGTREVMEFRSDNGVESLRLMRPMIMQEGCMKCHGHLGFKVGDVRGGVGVNVPMEPYRNLEYAAIRGLVFTYGGIYVTGVFVIGILMRRAQRRIRKEVEVGEEIHLAARVFENALEAIIITDPSGVILRVNKAFVRITGFREEEALGKTPGILKSEHQPPNFYKNMWETLLQEGRWQGEIWNRKKDGEVFVAWENISAAYGMDGSIKFFIGSFSDITEKKVSEQRIQHLAHYDALTELPNRVLFHATLEQAMRDSESLSLLFLDLDGFKKINDSMGHPMGDDLLGQVARRIRGSLGSRALVFSRVGGDEFLVLLHGVEKASGIAVEILESLVKPFHLGNREVFISGSIGISVYPEDGEDAGTLIQHADSAMYLAKGNGKNQFRFYSRDLTLEAEKRIQLEGELRRAIRNQEFIVYYQPRVSTFTGKIIGMEALVRWNHPDKGLVFPDSFIPLAEEMGLIPAIDEIVIQESCRYTNELIQAGHDLRVSANLSIVNLGNCGMIGTIKKILDTTKIDPNQIELEITESYFLQLDEMSLQCFEDIRKFGIGLSIDDFGTGYSSLLYLRQIPAQILKIDKSFIENIHQSIEDRTLVSNIISLAHGLGLEVVAEGVETCEHARILKSMDCDQMQGYYFARPLPPAEFEKFLDRAKTGIDFNDPC